MQKHELATQLRLRQYARELVPRKLIDALSDDQIIETYITCSDCGVRCVSEQELQTAIRMSDTADSFLALTESVSH